MHCNMCSEKNPCPDCLISEVKEMKKNENMYDNNICIICDKQHKSKQEMIDCGCISTCTI
jgi:hypothetical protein